MGPAPTFARNQTPMKRNTLVYGLVSGTLVSALMLLSMNYLSYCNGAVDYNTSMLVGYASMLVAFSLVFVGVRNFRDKFNGGVISFGKAFRMGLLMVLIASTMYVVAWQIDYYFFMPDFFDKYTAHILEALKSSGASTAEIEKQTREMAGYKEMYKNPFYNAMFTYMEILPVGLIVTLLCALLLKRKEPRATPASIIA